MQTNSKHFYIGPKNNFLPVKHKNADLLGSNLEYNHLESRVKHIHTVEQEKCVWCLHRQIGKKVTFCVILRAIIRYGQWNDKIQKNLACFAKELTEWMAAHVISCSIWLCYILQLVATYSSVLQPFKFKFLLLPTAMPSSACFWADMMKATTNLPVYFSHQQQKPLIRINCWRDHESARLRQQTRR